MPTTTDDRGELYVRLTRVINEEATLKLSGFARAKESERRRVLDRLIDEITGRLPVQGDREDAIRRVADMLRDTPGFNLDGADPAWRSHFLTAIVDAVATYQDPVTRAFSDELERRAAADRHAAMRAVQIADRAMQGHLDLPADLHVLAELRDQLEAPVAEPTAATMLAVLREHPSGTERKTGELVCVEIPEHCLLHEGDTDQVRRVLEVAHKLGLAWRSMAPSGITLWLLEQLAEATSVD